jgi:hypothetical protein
LPADPSTAPPHIAYFADIVKRIQAMEPSSLRERSIVTGTAEQCVGHLKRVEAAGIDEVICYFNFGGLDHERTLAQMQRARVRVEYLNTGRSETLAPNAPLVVTGHRDAPALRTNLSVLADLLEKARRQGWAASRAGDGAAVVALDMRGVPEDGGAVERAQRYERRFINGLGRLWRDPPTYEWNSSDRVLRDAKNAIAATAPFSILPLDPEDCAALALGFASWGKTKTSTKSGQPQPHRSSSVSAHGCGLGSWGDRLLELWRRESFREEVLWRLRKRARFGLFFLRRL